MKNILSSTLLLLLLGFTSCKSTSQPVSEHQSSNVYLVDWNIESSTQVKESPENISSTAYDQQGWIPATVPTTVLRALVAADVYPDPHLDLNNFKIPDASDELNKKLKLEKFSHIEGVENPFKHAYWFRTTFTVDPSHKDDKTWLNFDGINYRADVWLNGKQIADSSEMVSMFQRFKYDVTDAVKMNEPNVLAVKIYQVDHPGTPDPGAQLEVFGPQRGWGTDIFKDATLKFTAGWDCAPVVRDRNMGIYQDVFLSFTKAVDIIDPYVMTDLPLPDTNSAELTISAEYKNNSDQDQKGKIRGSISLLNEIDFITYTKQMSGSMKPIAFEKEVNIPAGQTATFNVGPDDVKELMVKNPYLWWPNGYGQQYLYRLHLEFVDADGQVSDQEQIDFGIREIENTLKELNGEYGRIFWVNGQRIFSKGGWLQPDMLLDMSPKRMYDEARLLANANVNMIANEDMPSPPNLIMEAYDKYGLLMWETFFQCWTSYPGTESFANPSDTELALKHSYDIIKRYRRHASLVLWAVACETVVREEIYVPLRKYVKDLDPSRPFLATSSYDWDIDSLTPYMKPDLPLGMTDDGAPDYTWYPHDYYYDMILKVHQQMFRNELGVPSVPTWSSMKKFIFDLGQGPKDDIYPLDKNWAHHGAWDDDGYVYRAYDEALRNQFGKDMSAEEYVKYAQYINAGSYRAMFEAANHRMWDITSGVMLWKLNSTWPTVVWQIFDWYLNPNAAYFYTKNAIAPLHIQMNEHNEMIAVINSSHKSYQNLSAVVEVLNYDLSVAYKDTIAVNIESDRFKELGNLPKLFSLSPTYFVNLSLQDSEGKILSENFYWQSTSEEKEFDDLKKLPAVELDLAYKASEKNGEIVVEVDVANNSEHLALLQRIVLLKGENGEEVLPTIWSDNFITLLPGKSKKLFAHVSKQDLGSAKPVVIVDPLHR